MSLKRFFGMNSKDALQKVRMELGEDAAILSNKDSDDGGVEIVAVSSQYIASLPRKPSSPVPLAAAERTPTQPRPVDNHRPPPVPAPQFHPSWSTPRPDQEVVHQRGSAAPISQPPQNSLDQPNPSAAAVRYQNVDPQPRFQPPPAHQPPKPKPTPTPTPTAYHQAQQDPRGNSSPKSNYTEPGSGNFNAPQRPAIPAQPRHQQMPSPLISNAPFTSDHSSSADIAKEVRALREIMEGQLAAMAWDNMRRSDPGKMSVIKAMLNAGFSSLLARTLSRYTQVGASPAQALTWLQMGLSKHVRVFSSEIIDTGGVFALVGPTGVGKTTTTAKIAARCAMRYGPRSFALVTTDSYRVAAEEQLAGYGKILGCPVYTVRTSSDLRSTVDELVGKKVILIDTVGMSQRDQRVAEQIAMLAGTSTVQKLLVLNCSSSGAVLDEVAASYSADAGSGGLCGVILSKADESVQIGPALDIAIRRKLPVAYVTTGQRVPEDIHVPSPIELIRKAFSVGENPFSISDFEIQTHAVVA